MQKNEKKNSLWWQDKVAYQIYPKSFLDTNGDGIGDLRGIINKLDYLKDLGVDIIWISPMFASPMLDQGYDISDYYVVNPIFGTMEDMEELIREAKKRDLYILLDLVISHCSYEHEWFQKAMEDLESEYADYFYIKEGKDGQPPCNWRSYFGGSVWEPIEGTNKYYLHSFHKSQPDLNWENEVVRRKLYDMVCWWLEKGIDGFRIDAIINIKKQLEFKDYEADREDGLCSIGKMLQDAHGIGEFLDELKRESFEKYSAFTVGEVFNVKPGEKEKFVGKDGYFSTIFDFSVEEARTGENWYECEVLSPEQLKAIMFCSQFENLNTSMLANVIENHDEPRGASAFFRDENHCDERKSMLAAAYLFLRGIPFIYQGQEIGMTNVKYDSIEDYDDIATIDQYQVALEAGYSDEDALTIIARRSRDNARTPMQWNDGAEAGFTTGKPWLKTNPNYKNINVEAQENDANSVLSQYKQMIKLRKSEEYRALFAEGGFAPYKVEVENLFAYYRTLGERRVLVLCNYQADEVTVEVDGEIKEVLYNNLKDLCIADSQVKLRAYQAIITLN